MQYSTTVGIFYDDHTFIIKGTAVGGPAFNSRKVYAGDKITAIDGTPVVKTGDAFRLLKGVDKPGRHTSGLLSNRLRMHF